MIIWDYISNIGLKNNLDKTQVRSVQLINRLILISSLIAVIYLPILFWLKAFWMGVQLSTIIILILGFLFISASIKIKYAITTIGLIMMYHMTAVSIVVQHSQLELYIILITLIQFAVIKHRGVSFLVFILGIISYFISLYFQETRASSVMMDDLQKATMISLNSLGIFVGGLYLIFQVKNSNAKYQIEILKERKRVLDQNKRINDQVKIIENAHKEITDSINYSKRIQRALLPSNHKISTTLPDSFVLYKPKDIVAGDFYWIHNSSKPLLFAVGDCTGHGVPGAMMSVICINALNRAIKEFKLSQTNDILDQTRELVIQDLDAATDNIRDGMDIALCSIENNTLHYSGANIKLLLIRNEKITEFKADKQPIGQYISKKKDFTKNEIEIIDGDLIYLITDGYVDQFGGKYNKKFKTPALKKLLLANSNKSMSEQKEVLNTKFEEWKGTAEQIDDVCVMGIRFSN